MNSSRTPTGRLSLKILEKIPCLILRATVNNLQKIGSVKSQAYRSLIIFIAVWRYFSWIEQAIPFNFLDIDEFIVKERREKYFPYSAKSSARIIPLTRFGGNVKSKYIFMWEPSLDGRCDGPNKQTQHREIICLKMKRTKQQSLFSVWKIKNDPKMA